ncbi:Mth938-like domain-containing protein [Thioflexithrix psekupsensis]|uniref:Xcc1710-like domain-containing protein n=1 Tax=Thioflexithrix psekupsensis TaxID=1570016 RepID=A0A251X8N6_9GAMM|nr:Mth938-like domain-containing protein [Thioflexithrix psekupsensis]OUD14295.1 hypothetical protein TPSD3_08200 [Thioflexithrix psekupsensis]
MKLHLEDILGYRIQSYQQGQIKINDTMYRDHLIVMPHQLLAWTIADPLAISMAEMEVILAHRPELIVLGTGALQRFPHRSVMEAVLQMGIGLEVMATQAACYTYNIVAAEGRQVAAALLLEPH